MNNIKVSIVTIAYNQEKFIRQALESFVTQKTDFAFEVVIADDCSTDKTAAIIKEYVAAYPSIFKATFRTKNVGSWHNLLGVLRAARGTYIALCDGDDYWTDPNKLQIQVDFMDSHANYALCFHPVRVFFEDGSEAEYIYPDPKKSIVSEFTIKALLAQNFIQTNSVMYRRQQYKDLPPDIMPGDWYLHLYHAQFGKIGFINKVMSAYRRHSGGIWQDAFKDRDRLWEKHGLSHLGFYTELLKLYGKNTDYRTIIETSFVELFERLFYVDKKYNEKLVKTALQRYPDYVELIVVSQHERLLDQELSLKNQELVINDLSELNQNRLGDYKQIEDNLKVANDELASIRTSTSWRLTSPLRRGKSVAIRAVKASAKKVIPKSYMDIYRNQKKLQSFNINYHYFSEKRLRLPKHSAPKVSIIIPVYNKWPFTYICLESLQNLQSDTSFEIIIVDDGSNFLTRLGVKRAKNLKYVRNKTNLGFVKSCNTGAKVATGEYVLFLNNDVIVKPGWLDSLLLTFTEHDKVGLVGSKLIYPDGRLQEAGGIVWRNKNAANYGKFGDPNSYEFNYLKEVDYVSGASLIIPKELFKKVGGFGEEYSPGYCEDTDLAFKVRQSGFKVIYQPLSEVIHFEGITSGTDLSTGMKKYQTDNFEKFYKKWEKVLKRENQLDTNGPYLARDRSQTRKVLFYVDRQVPQGDQDAGSFLTLQYLKILTQLDYKVIFWPNDLYKVPGYTDKLQQLGVEVVYGDLLFEQYIHEYGKFIDITILSRVTMANEHIDSIKENTNSKVHYFTMDLHYLRELRQAKVENNEVLKKNSLKTKAIELEIMLKSDLTWVVSSEEVKILSRELPYLKTFLCPWVEQISEHVTDFTKRQGIIFLGGFNHAPNIDAVTWFKNEIFPKLQSAKIEVTIIGSNPTNEIKSLAEDNFKIVGFVPDEELEEYLSKSKLFISPLRYGAGFKGKIAKSLSRGLPVISTSIGAEGMGLEDGKNILIADSPAKFANMIVELHSNAELWGELSSNSLIYSRKNLSFESAKAKLSKII